MACTTRTFTLSSKLEKPIGPDQVLSFAVTEEHFGILWTLKSQVAFYGRVSTELSCSVPPNYYTKSASFSVRSIFLTYHTANTRDLVPTTSGLPEGSNTLENDFEGYETFLAQNNKVTMKFAVTVEGPIAICRSEKMRDFSQKELGLTDVVLIVGEEMKKFHVSKVILGTHSTYFHTMFFGAFQESEKSEVELKDIDPAIFQLFLEVLYLCPNIHEMNVENLLDLARIYGAQPVTAQCQKFINGENALPMEEKQRLREEYL